MSDVLYTNVTVECNGAGVKVEDGFTLNLQAIMDVIHALKEGTDVDPRIKKAALTCCNAWKRSHGQ